MSARFASLALGAAVTLLGTPGLAGADAPYHLLIGGRPTDVAGRSARLHDGTLYVDVVRATRALGGVLTFHGREKSVLVTAAGHTVDYIVSSKTATLDGNDIALPAAPYVAQGITYVPLATFAKAAGATYTADAKTRTIAFVPASGPIVVPPTPAPAGAAVPAPSPTAS